MKKAELQHRVHELEMELLEAKYRSQSKQVIEKQTFIPETRKIKTFCGRPKSKSDISVDDWIDDIEIAFSARKYSDTQKVDLIYSHLEGQAKEEVKFRPDIRQDPHAILDCLRVAFGNPESVTSLQQKFFERHQLESETIRHYSYALLDLYQNVIRKDRSVFPNKHITLCEKFANGLRDSLLRKEAKKLLRNEPTDFHKFRDEIILFSEEEEMIDKDSANSTHSNTISDQHNLNTQPSDSPTTEQLLKIIEAQQKQIDSLTGLIRDRGTSQHTKENRDFYRSPPVCYECGKVGHMQRNCRSKPSETTAGSSENKSHLLKGVR